MFTRTQQRIVITTIMLMLLLYLKPNIVNLIKNGVSNISWNTINVIGPVTLPMLLVLIFSSVCLLKLIKERDISQIKYFIERINFHTDTAVMLGTIGTFIAVFEARNNPDLASVTMEAMLSTIVGMSAKLVFKYCIDFVVKMSNKADKGYSLCLKHNR